MRSSSSSSSGSGSNSARDFDCIANYEVHEEIARGGTSVVYRAICKRGRLRNRQVAIKKVPISSVSCEDTRPSLHQALHHPSVVSLFSEFVTPSDSYQVLELCTEGSLSSFLSSRRPSVLSEDELRGILKSIVDALTYLRKQRILHGDLNPDNVLLTNDLRAKLSGFNRAAQLVTMSSTTSTFGQTNEYTAPEIKSRIPYSFSADIWSLGCIMWRSLTGSSSPEAHSSGNSSYTLSSEAQDLITQMLQTDPDRRIPLHRILLHAFFKRLRQSQHLEKENECTPRPAKPSRYPALLSKGAPPSTGPLADLRPVTTIDRKPLSDARNRDLRMVLSDEVSGMTVTSGPVKRFASAPQSGSLATKALRLPPTQSARIGLHSLPATPTLTDDTASVSSREDVPGGEEVPRSLGSKRHVEHPLLSRPHYQGDRRLAEPLKQRLESHSSQEKTAVGTGPYLGSRATSAASGGPESTLRQASVVRAPPFQTERRSASAPHVPSTISSSNPNTISTVYLSVQTHKVAHGQLVVLPSKSLLVDFREGERRRGKRGNEVLLISPDGAAIQVYSAPHLSTPCCLAEPLATYTLISLPEVYRKAYDDAKRLVNQLKQRVPKLVLYEPDFKCTLMANEPFGDIELTFGRGSSLEHIKSSDTSEGAEPQMRISLRRRRQAVEIARFVPSAHAQAKTGTGEWTRKVLPVTIDYLCVSAESLAALETVERDGLDRLARFLRLCEGLETQERELGSLQSPADALGLQLHQGATGADTSCSEDGRDVAEGSKEGLAPHGQAHCQVPPVGGTSSHEDESGTWMTMATMASTKTLPSVELAPRPSKFPSTRSRATSSASRIPAGSGSKSGLSAVQPLSLPTSCAPCSSDRVGSGVSSAERLDTRFIRSLGWCIRSVSAGSESFKIMFQDGAVLQLDLSGTGEKIIWYAEGPEDQPIRLSGASAARMIPKRMEAYSMFIEMFRVDEF